MGEIFNDSGSFDDVALVPPILQGEYVPSIDTPKIEDGFKLIIPFGGGRTTRSGTEYVVSAEGGATRTDYGGFDSVPASKVSYDLSNLLAPMKVTTVPVPGGIFDLDRTLKQIQVLGTEKDVLVYTSDIITVLEEHAWDEVTPLGEGESSRWTDAAISDDQMKAVVTKYYPANEKALYFTGDGADNWTEKTWPGSTQVILDMSRDGNMILAMPASGTQVFISTDDADSWDTKTVTGSSQNWHRCAIDSDGSHLIIASRTNIFVSTDSGENWSDVSPEGPTWVSVACNEDGSVMLASNGSLFLTEDYGSSWSELSPFTIADSCVSIAVNDDGTKMVAIDGSTKISISTDGGDTWDESTISGASTVEKVFMNDSGRFILIKQYYGPIIISYDSGSSWTFLGSIEDPEAGYGWTNLVHAINKSTGELALIGYLTIYRGTGSGYPEDYWSETTLTSFARSLIDDSDAASADTTLGLGIEDSPEFAGLTLTDLTATRLVQTNASKTLASVTNLTSWIAGTANQITSTSDGDGTLTLSTPQDIHTGASPTFVSPIFTTQLTCPKIIGGVATTSDLYLQTTSGVGTTGADMHFLVGNNGATEAMTILNNGNVGIGTTGPTGKTDIQGLAIHDLPTYSAEFLLGTTWVSTGWTGDFATGWTHTTGNVSVLSHDKVAVNATKYQIAYTVTGRTAGSFTIGFGGQSNGGLTATGAWGPTTSSTASLTITPTTDFDGTIVISIKSITAVSTPLVNLKSSDGVARIEMRANTATGNTFIGVRAGIYNTTGYYNTANGYQSLRSNTTGNQNTANGLNSLYSNTTGDYNTANGLNSLFSNTTGDYNTTSGYASLFSNTTGDKNTANGMYSLYSNTTGDYNTTSGYASLFSNTTGNQNTANGVNSLYSNTTGDYNTANGLNAGRTLITGNSNTFLGYEAGYNASQKTCAVNSMALGNRAFTTEDNQVVIGNTSVTQTLLNGNVGIGTTTPTAVLHLKAGTATGSTAPLKFTAGTNLTSPEAGVVEFDGTSLYFTPSATRQIIVLTNSSPTFAGLNITDYDGIMLATDGVISATNTLSLGNSI